MNRQAVLDLDLPVVLPAPSYIPLGLSLRKWPEKDLQPGTMCRVVSGSWAGSYGRLEFPYAGRYVFLLIDDQEPSRAFPAEDVLPAWIADFWRM